MMNPLNDPFVHLLESHFYDGKVLIKMTCCKIR